MKQEAVDMGQKKISWIIYGILVLSVVFTMGFFLGSNQTPATVQVTVAAPAEEPAAPQRTNDETSSVTADGVVDLNTADQAALETLPGIGPELASRILAYREQYGMFVSKEQIMDVDGIGQGRYEKIEAYLTVGGTQ